MCTVARHISQKNMRFRMTPAFRNDRDHYQKGILPISLREMNVKLLQPTSHQNKLVRMLQKHKACCIVSRPQLKQRSWSHILDLIMMIRWSIYPYHDVDKICWCWTQPIRSLKLGHVRGQISLSSTCGTGVWSRKNSFHKVLNKWMILLYIWIHS